MTTIVSRPITVAVCMAAVTTLAAAAPATRPTTAPAGRMVRVAIYTDAGAPDGPKSGPANVIHCLGLDARPDRYHVVKVKGADVRAGILADVDVAVFPGGSGSGQARSLGEGGRAAVREFVRRGGGYVGICGGAYLATSYYPWSLNIVNAKVVDREHWNRGDPTPVKLELTPLGRTQLDHPDDAEVTCIYHQGPLLGPWHRSDVPAYEPLATFGSEVTQRAPHGVMIGTDAVTRSAFGRGHVILISPHPERSPGLDGFIRTSVDWVGQGPSAGSVTPPEAGDASSAPPATEPAAAADR